VKISFQWLFAASLEVTATNISTPKEKRTQTRLRPPVCCLPPPGIHYIGDLLEHKPFRCMLDSMTNGQLQWEPLENPFDQVVLGPPENRRRYPIYSGRTRFPEELKKCFPGEEKAIDEYLKLVKVGSLWSGQNITMENIFSVILYSFFIHSVFNCVKCPFPQWTVYFKNFSRKRLHYPDFCCGVVTEGLKGW